MVAGKKRMMTLKHEEKGKLRRKKKKRVKRKGEN